MAAMSDVNAVATPPDGVDDDELDWEEWDGRSPFVHHCLAGSVAGIAEHTLLYPVDTVKTHMQSYCADCPYNNSTAAATTGNANPSNLMRGASSKAAKTAAAAAVHPVRGQVPGAVHMAGTTTSAGSTSASAAAAAVAPPHPRQGAHGMWRTMTNIVYSGSGHGYHGPLHQFEPRIGSSSSSLAVLNRSAAAAKCAAEELAAKGAGAAAATTGDASVMRLFRGVQTMLVGCAPAHALYFSSYEIVKALFLAAENPGHPATPAPLLLPLTTNDIEATSSAIVEAPHLSPLGSASAGAVATVMHDAVMTPLDTIKQRLQLGHYSGSMTAAARSIVNTEGWAGLYRSLPVTLAANVPYGAVMVSTNEFLKYTLNPEGTFDIKTYVAAGCGAGMVAAASTTPLDRVKTRLQTQRMGSAMELAAAASASERAAMEVSPRCDHIPYGPRCGKAQAEAMIVNGGGRARYAGVGDALRSIVREEGYVGLFRGLTPRVLMHTPAVAISWTTYESAKKWLADNFPQ